MNLVNNTHKNCKKVVCINTEDILDSVRDAETKYGVDKSLISKVCNGIRKTAGKLDGNPIGWAFLEDWEKLDEAERQRMKNNLMSESSKVICLNTGEIFSSIQRASKKYNISRMVISNCCKYNSSIMSNRYVSYAGKLNEKKAVWMYLNDFKKIDKCNIEDYLKKAGCFPNSVPIVCLNTRERFDSIVQASKKYSINNDTIRKCCAKKIKSAGKMNGERAIWMFEEEYNNLCDKEISDILSNPKVKASQVVCLNTGDVFNSIKEASKSYSIDASNISACCRKKLVHAKGMAWAYLYDYRNMTESEIKTMIQVAESRNLRKR